MSEKGYWRARPVARTVYEQRACREKEKNFEILSGGINFSAAILGAVGFCMGNLDMIFTSLIMTAAAKALR